MRQQQVGVAHGQQRIGAGADVRRIHVGQAGLLHHCGQLHAAKCIVVARRDQTGVGECPQRRPDLIDQRDRPAIEVRFVLVGLLVVRREQFGGDAFAGVQCRVEGLAAVVGIAFGPGQ